MSKREYVKIDATPEQAAQAIFSAVKPPDPTKRKGKKATSALSQRKKPLLPRGGSN